MRCPGWGPAGWAPRGLQCPPQHLARAEVGAERPYPFKFQKEKEETRKRRGLGGGGRWDGPPSLDDFLKLPGHFFGGRPGCSGGWPKSLFFRRRKKSPKAAVCAFGCRERERGGPAENGNFFPFGEGPPRRDRGPNGKTKEFKGFSFPTSKSFLLPLPARRASAARHRKAVLLDLPRRRARSLGPARPGGRGAANPTPPLISENFCEEGIPEGKKAPRDRRAKAFSFPTESRQWISLPPSRRPFLPRVRGKK